MLGKNEIEDPYKALEALKEQSILLPKLLSHNKNDYMSQLQATQLKMRQNYSWVRKITNELMKQHKPLAQVDNEWINQTFEIKEKNL